MEIDQSINQSVIWHGLNSNKIEPTWTRYAESFQVQEDSIHTYTLGNMYVCILCLLDEVEPRTIVVKIERGSNNRKIPE